MEKKYKQGQHPNSRNGFKEGGKPYWKGKKRLEMTGEKHPNYMHGMSNTRIHNNWSNMISRCTNPKNPCYPRYGGRGIGVCKRWMVFENFYEDMGDPPEGMSLERKDNNKGYHPDNVVWDTRTSQANNRRTNKMITYNGKTQTMAQWSRETGIHQDILYKRFKRNWSAEKALTTTPQ